MSGLPYVHPFATTPARSAGPVQSAPIHQHGAVAVSPFVVKHTSYTDRTTTTTTTTPWDQASFEQPAKRQRVEKAPNVRFITQKWNFSDKQQWVDVQPSAAKTKIVPRKSSATAGGRLDASSPRQMSTPATPQFAADGMAQRNGVEDMAVNGESTTGQPPATASEPPRYMTQQMASTSFAQSSAPLSQASGGILHAQPDALSTGRPSQLQQNQPTRGLQIQTPALYDDNVPPKLLISPTNTTVSTPQVVPKSKPSPNQALSLEKDADRIAALIAEKKRENEVNSFRQRMMQKQREYKHQKETQHATVVSTPTAPLPTVMQALPVQTPKVDIVQSVPPDFSKTSMDFPSPLIPGRRPPTSAAKERAFTNLSTSARPIKQRPNSSQGRKEQSTSPESSPPHQNVREAPLISSKALSQPGYQPYPVPVTEHRSQSKPSTVRSERRPTVGHKPPISAVTKHRPASRPTSRPASRRSSMSGTAKTPPGMTSITNHNSRSAMAVAQDQLYLSRNPSSHSSPQQIPGTMPDMWNVQEHSMQYVSRALGDTNERSIVSAPSTQLSSPAMSNTAMPSPPKMQISRSQQGNVPRRHPNSMPLPPQPPNTPFTGNMSQAMMTPSMHASMAAPPNCFAYDVGQSDNSGYYYGSAAPQTHLSSNPVAELPAIPPNAGTTMTSQLPQGLHPTRPSSHIGAGNGAPPLHSVAVDGYSGADLMRKQRASMFPKGYSLAHGSMGSVSMTGG